MSVVKRGFVVMKLDTEAGRQEAVVLYDAISAAAIEHVTQITARCECASAVRHGS